MKIEIMQVHCGRDIMAIYCATPGQKKKKPRYGTEPVWELFYGNAIIYQKWKKQKQIFI